MENHVVVDDMGLRELQEMVSQNKNQTEFITLLRTPEHGFHMFKEPYRYIVHY